MIPALLLAAAVASTPPAPPPPPQPNPEIQQLRDQIKRLNAIVDALQVQRNTLADQAAMDAANAALAKSQPSQPAGK